jgi:cell wall-associated NlpC family hydrolase
MSDVAPFKYHQFSNSFSVGHHPQKQTNMRKTLLLIVLLAIVCFTFARSQRRPTAESDAEKFKIGKALKSIGKGALKVGKAYVGQKYGVQLADEEAMSEKKVNIDEIFEWIQKGKVIYDIFKKNKKSKTEEPAPAVEEPVEEESDAEKFNIGKTLKSIGKGALKVGKAYVGQKYGIQLSETMSPGQSAANWARSKVGGCYSQAKRDGNPCYDCSSLVYYAWRAAGVNIGATNTRMYPARTHKVSASQLQPGDILWRQGHVGMYIGNNQYVNAESTATGIRQRTFNASKWTAFYRPN